MVYFFELVSVEMAERNLVIGVDVGGTNTDAVILCGRGVLSKSKCLTTKDVTSGVVAAINTAIKALDSEQEGPGRNSGVAERVCRVNIGTTHFINAVIQKRDLAKVSVVRLCGTASTALPPFCKFPKDLADTIRSSVHFVKGGYEFNVNEIDSIDEHEIRDCFSAIRDSGCENVVICGVFSPVCGDQETRVLQIAKEVHPGGSYTLSHQVGRVF